jgi:hypothetical protein
MLRVFRVRAWCLATALVLALGTATASFEALLHVDGAHDDACAPTVAGPHDESAHRIRSASAADHDGQATHCLACHWARSFRLFTASLPAAPKVDERGTPRLASHPAPIVAPTLANLAPRSPPASAEA